VGLPGQEAIWYPRMMVSAMLPPAASVAVVRKVT
jgi:hypothetical protein